MTAKSQAARWTKLALQINLGVFSAIAFFYAVLGLAVGATPYYEGTTPPPALDNQARFVAGVYLLFPFLIWWIIPSIERHATPIRLLAAGTMCGGIGRLISLVQFGSDDTVQLGLMVFEISAPLLIPWQSVVARQHADAVDAKAV
jgi:hypothetical protein